MMKQAFDNATGSVWVADEKIIRRGVLASRKSERRRIILPIHRQQDAPVQRMLNFLQPETYVRPHLHPRPEAVETIFVIQGALVFFIFDETGSVLRVERLGEAHPCRLLDLEPQVWHSFVVSEPDTVILETKLGPYDTKLDKIFAPWAPEEGSQEAQHLIENWKEKYT